MPARSACLALIACLLPMAQTLHAQIRSDERVVFFPAAARQDATGANWILPIRGWIFEPEKGDLLRNASVTSLATLMGLDSGSARSELFQDRCRSFLVDNERGKTIRVILGSQAISLGPSTADGQVSSEISMAVNLVGQPAGNQWISYRAELPAGDKRSFSGAILLVPPTGLSVISDIDDTIKVSEVTNKRRLLQNTFLNEYRAVDGMAARYRQWANAGVVVHYVSSSPWQLYEPIQQMTDAAGFPPAAFHLKDFRLKDSGWQTLFADPMATKPPVIESILRSYPQRQFVLIGDSGEHDPEVYGEIARRYPQQIRSIFIRDVTSQPPSSDRYRTAFQGVDPNIWLIFTDPAAMRL